LSAGAAVATEASSDASRAASGALALTGLQLVGRAAAIGFVLVATRLVVPDQWSTYAVVAGLVAFAGFIADFGSTTVLTRIVSRDAAASHDLLAQTLLASVVVGLLGYVGVFAFVCVGPYSREVVVAMAIAGLAVPLDAALTSILSALDGHGLTSRRTTASFARVLVITVGGTLAVLATHEVRLAVVALVVGPFVGLVLAVRAARRHHVWTGALHPCLASSIELFRAALPYALLGGIGAVVARLDFVILSLWARPATTAEYDLALRALEGVVALGVVGGAPALYILSRRMGAGDHDGVRRAYGHAARVAYLLGIPASVAIVVLHQPIVDVVLGPKYTAVGPMLGILAASAWLAILSTVQGAMILAEGCTARALQASLVILVVAAGLDVALIRTFGAAGAAWATVGAAMTSCIVFDLLNRRVTGIATPLPSLRLVLACGVSAAVLVAVTAVVHGPWSLLAVGVIPVTVFAARAVTPADARELRYLIQPGHRA
jgi:O-antigen/teichoic acid export membrane protein